MRELSDYGLRQVTMVSGYVPVDSLPRIGRKLGLRDRVAVVLGSYFEGVVDSVLDERTYVEIAGAAAAATRADTWVIREGTASRELHQPAEFEEFLRNSSEPGEPVEEIRLVRAQQVVGLLVSEPWVNVGGPPPYHDAFVFALYASQEICRNFEDGLARLCQARAIALQKILGTRRPPSLLKTLFSSLFR